MTNFRRGLLLKCLEFFDVALIGIAFGLATLAVYYRTGTLDLGEFVSMRVELHNAMFVALYLLGGHVACSAFGLYRSKRLTSRGAEILDTLKAAALGALLVLVTGKLFHRWLLTPLFAAVFFMATTGMLISSRMLLRWFLCHVRRRGRNLRHMLIVGTNSRAVGFAREIESRPEFGYRILGFVDDEWSGTGKFHQNGYALLTNVAGLKEYIRNNVVDEVVVELPIKSHYQVASGIIDQCEEQGIVVRYLSDLFNPKLAKPEAEQLDGRAAAVSWYTGPHDEFELFVKRALDAVLSFILIVLLSPLFLFIAIGIKLTSPGPVFFVQDRIGLNKHRFPLLKFRTMVPDADKRQGELERLNEMSGPVFKIKDDPRITAIGRILRKTSLDELPQLINVLKGDMSLVGPRPLPLRDYEGFDCDWHRRRFSVRPGITCLWQVNGRNRISFEHWMELDMEYIDQWSLSLDLRILVKTVPAVLRGYGAQ